MHGHGPPKDDNIQLAPHPLNAHGAQAYMQPCHLTKLAYAISVAGIGEEEALEGLLLAAGYGT